MLVAVNEFICFKDYKTNDSTNKTLLIGFDLHAVSRVLLILSAKCTGFEKRTLFQIARPPASVLLHKVCVDAADRESNPESPETEVRIPLNIHVSRPQTNCTTIDKTVLKTIKF
jgi:hypothetical protein